MRSVTERCSNRSRATPCAVLAVLLACACSVARAQAPSCAWGDGVALPGSDARQLLITDDGAAGVLAITWEVSTGAPYALRFFHVLEQGKLDPGLPADGVTIVTGADLPATPAFFGVRACSDGVGGAYLLFGACNPTTAHTRCYEIAVMRLLRLTPQGTAAPGWPALGIALPPVAGLPTGGADIVPDAAAGSGTARGVIAAWIDGSSFASPPVYAQRFAPDGTTLWPGGLSGLAVLDGQTPRLSFRLAGDHAGGATVVATQRVSGSSTQFAPRAGRVLAGGSLPWTTAGKSVVVQPTCSVRAQALAMDEQGRSFVTVELSPLSGGPGGPRVSFRARVPPHRPRRHAAIPAAGRVRLRELGRPQRGCRRRLDDATLVPAAAGHRGGARGHGVAERRGLARLAHSRAGAGRRWRRGARLAAGGR